MSANLDQIIRSQMSRYVVLEQNDKEGELAREPCSTSCFFVVFFFVFFLHSRVSESVAGPTLMKYSTRPLLRGCCFKRRTTLHGATSEVDAALLLCLVNNWRQHHITSAGQSGPTCWTLSGFISAFRMKGLLGFLEGGVLDLVLSKAKCPGACHKENKINVCTPKNRNSFSVEGWKGGKFLCRQTGTMTAPSQQQCCCLLTKRTHEDRIP